MMTENPYQSPLAESLPPELPSSDPSATSLTPSIRFGVVIQLGLFVLTALILDGGATNRHCVVAIIGYWIGALPIIVRRRKTPTKVDLLFLRWGMLLMMLLLPFIVGIVYGIIGESHLNGLERWF